MKKKYFCKYYMMMGFITLIIMLAALAGLIILVVHQFNDKAGFWPITATFLNMLAVLVMGSGISNLFYSFGYISHQSEKECCN